MLALILALALCVSAPSAQAVWNPVDPDVGDLEFMATPGLGTGIAVAGPPEWRAQSVELRLRPLFGSAGSTGVYLHHQDPDNTYLFQFATYGSSLILWRVLDGGYTLLAQSRGIPLVLGEDYLLRMETDLDGALRVLWSGELLMSAVDSTFRSGRIGFEVWNMVARYDDVVVRDAAGKVIFSDDFEDGVADGWEADSA